MVDFERRALEFIRKQNMLKKGDRIIAGVSGGADSVCMLTLLLALAPETGHEVFVVHINHGIRGEGADRDESFVRELCEKKGVPFYAIHGDIPALARESGETEEEAGRNFRYASFRKLALELGCSRIAVAHNSDDNAETVLFNIFRGSGISGVRGILPVRGVKAPEGSAEGSLTLIRPLLVFSRKEIEEYLCSRKQEWCTDETNLQNDYSRNKIRNVLLPMVKAELNSNASGHIGELSSQAAELEDFLKACVEKELPRCDFSHEGEVFLEENHIRGLHSALRRALLRCCFERLSGRLKDVESRHISLIEEMFDREVGKSIDLPYNLKAVRRYKGVTLVSCKPGEAVGAAGTASGNDGRQTTVGLELVMRESLPGKFPENPDIQWFDAGKLQETPVIRRRQEGDYLLIGSKGHRKSLNRFMIDSKIPVELRDEIDILAEGHHVLWVPGFRRDDSCYITEDTTRVLVAELKTLR